MKIKSLSVQKLFGRFDYDFDFTKNEDNLFMFHGLNGTGKTKILNLIKLACDKKFHQLRLEPFSVFQLVYCNDSAIRVTIDHTKKNDSTVEFCENFSTQKVFKSLTNKKKKQSYYQSRNHKTNFRLVREAIHYIDKKEPLTKIAPNIWKHMRTGEINESEVFVHRYLDLVPIELYDKLSSDLIEIEYETSKISSVSSKFINTKRLSNDLHRDLEGRQYDREKYSSLERLSKEISRQVKESISEYANETQKLDSNFVQTIKLKLQQPNVLDKNSILDRLTNLRKNEKNLVTVGLLEHDEVMNDITNDLDDNNNSLLHIIDLHCENTEKKLRIFDKLYSKINTFTSIINKRFSYKKIEINSDGIVILDKENNQPLLLETLSSGEQHELYLFGDLIFDSNKLDVLFIDEPEISLHIAWQNEFIDDLLQINTLKNTQILIATHSPSIIGNRYSSAFNLQDQSI